MTGKVIGLVVLCCTTQLMLGQVDSNGSANSSIPTIVKFSGSIREGSDSPSLQVLTFSLYKAKEDASPVWVETQSVSVDAQGHYIAYLGSPESGGIPVQLFVSGETQWIGVTPSNGVELPRVPIATVPYAFKAAEADTLGGRRPEEFISVQQLATLLGSSIGGFGTSSAVVSPGSPTTGDTASPTLNGLLHGLSDSAFAKLGITNIFREAQDFAGGIRLPANVPEAGQNDLLDSAPLDFESSIIQPRSGTYSKQTLRWASEPILSPSGVPAAKLSLLFGANSEIPVPTGFSLNSDGTINFAPGQVLPAAAVMEAISAGQSGSSGGGANSSNIPPIVNTAPYQWTETPSSSAIKAGQNTITLTPCPRGVNGNDAWHYLYISKTGTPEAVLITGGSCVAGQKSGTIDFTAQYDHPAGYSIGSATDGVQEAIIADTGASTGNQVPRNVLIDPGSHVFHARLSVRASSITISASGATITCAMSDTCIMLGDPSSGAFQRIVLNGLSVAAGIPNGTWPAVEDNANGSTIANLAATRSSVPNASLGSLVQVDNDQAAQITGLNTNLAGWSRCDTSFCSTAIVGPGSGHNSGVLWVQNSNLSSINCTANGIDNQNANTLHVSNTIVQAYPQFGIRSRSTYSNNPAVQLDNVYEEIGNCVNPLGTGMAGLIVEGGYANVAGSVGPNGELPVFANSGTTKYNYSVVVHSSVMGTSPAYLAGYANTSGTGAIPVVWNQVGNTGVVTYDVLRTTGAAAPFGTGAFAIATGIPASSCVNALCSFTDNASTQPSSYTVSSDTPYWPALKMWPGSVILTTPNDYQNNGGGMPTMYFTDNLNTGAGIVNSAGGFAPSVFAQVCNSQSSMSSVWTSCLAGNAVSNNNPAVTGTVLQLSNNGGSPGGLKGRVIFEMSPTSSVNATHVITLADSNPTKTMASPNNRPSWDPNDSYIGYDQPPNTTVSKTQVSFGAPVSISSYIGNTGDGINWAERLTKSAKIFQVPVQATNVSVNGVLTINGSCSGSGCGPFSPAGAQIKDSFTEPNTGTLGPNWTTTAGSWSVSNNQATFVGSGGSGDGDAALVAYTGSTFANDQRATAEIIYGLGGTTAAGVGVRMSASAETGYVCFASSGQTIILKYVAGVRSGLGSTGAGLPSGDYLTAQVTGNTISCLDNGVPIAGVTATDSSSPLSSGYPGMFGEYRLSSFLANFSAGSSTYTANGPITFAAGLQNSAMLFSLVPTCSSGTEGTQQAIVDSTSKTLGSTITGLGQYHVLAYCDGSNWIVGIAAQ